MFLGESSIQLVPDGTLLLHLLFIAVMVAVLNRTLLKPINQILSDREKHIQGRLDEAKAITSTSEEKLRAYHEALREARARGYKLLENQRAEGLKAREEKLGLFKEEMGRRISAETEATREQAALVRQQLEGEAKGISGLISSQILGQSTK